MKTFYEMTYSGAEDLMIVERDELHQFDIRLLWQGKLLKEALPRSVRLYVDGRRASGTDYVANRLSWPVCSQRFADLLLPLAEEDIQLLDAPLEDLKTKKPVLGFKIMNVVRLVECLDMEKSLIIRGSVITPVVASAMVPETVHVFRAAESPDGILLSERLVQRLRGHGLQGLALIKREST
jgi:hypothetical protein